jgi:cbb3-type cytochrome oxidase subunit 3
MQANKTHWPSLLILIVLGLSALFFLSISFALGMLSLIDLVNESSDAASKMITAFAAFVEFIFSIACGWFVLQKTMNRESAEKTTGIPFAVLPVMLTPVVVIAFAAIGGLTIYSSINLLTWFVLPTTSMFVIILPILFFLSIGSNGLEAGPRWRAWGIAGLGLTISPLVMITVELGILLVFFIGLIIFLVFQPEKLAEITELSNLLNQQPSDEVAVALLAPYITNPAVIGMALGYIALLVPMVEEVLKPLAVWIFGRSIQKPSQGFVLGLLSGGAFALLESLNASADSSATWNVVTAARAGTSLLHITMTGLMGYAIVGAFQQKKIGRLFGTYFAVVLIHGIWNACAAAAGFSILGEMVGRPEWLTTFLPASLCGLSVLGIGMFAILIAANRKIKLDELPVPTPLAAEEKE